MRSSFACPEAPRAGVDQRRRIRWEELGRPKEPCFREYQGELIEVRQQDIDAAQDNPDAVFAVLRFRPWTAPAYCRLTFLQISVTPAEVNPRRLPIRWSELGSPSKPGTFEYRGLRVHVQGKNIEAADRDPDAVFMATQIRPHTGHPYYVLRSTADLNVPS
jgi:hypothetical protein